MPGENCKTCLFDDDGFCLRYQVDVDPQHVCDTWTPKEGNELTHPDSGEQGERRYWETPEYRAKYSDKDREKMAKSGEAMPDGSYPIADGEDLDNAIHAVGRGGADHDAIRKHIIGRAKALGQSDKIPDDWNADGSLKDDLEGRAQVSTELAGSGLVVNLYGMTTTDAKAVADEMSWATQQAVEQAKATLDARPKKARHRAVPLVPEVRFFAPSRVEIRQQATDEDPRVHLSGAAIVYGVSYRVVDMVGEFRETIHPGAASQLIARKVDCRLLLNHAGLPMARTASGTMTLRDSPEALYFDAWVDVRQNLANDFCIAIERGDLSQMSIGMIVDGDRWSNGADGIEERDVYNLADLLDVSGVTYPCSPTTHIEVAQRMLLAAPIESRARLRRMEVELRAGATLSKGSQQKVLAALKALHDLADAGGVDVSEFVPAGDEEPGQSTTSQDGSTADVNDDEGESVVYPDGSGQRASEGGEERAAAATEPNEPVGETVPEISKTSVLLAQRRTRRRPQAS